VKGGGNNMKKIVGILIFILFLFSTSFTITEANLEKIDKDFLSETNDSSNNRYVFGLYIGTFIFNGIEYDAGFWWYNVTPINLRSYAVIYMNENYYFLNQPITENPAHINKDVFKHGFVGNRFMFIWGGSTF
jgi:hypothetical protein